MIQTMRNFACISLFLMLGCQTTQLETTWKDPNAGPMEFKKVAVLVLNSTPAERRAQEDEIVSQITQTTAVASYTFVPDDALRDRDKVAELIRAQNCDGAIVLRLISSDKVKTYVPGQENYFLSSMDYSWETPRSDPGYYTSDTFFRAEVSIYSVPDKKLIWSGASSTQDPANAKDLALQISRASTAELRKQGLLK